MNEKFFKNFKIKIKNQNEYLNKLFKKYLKKDLE